jgi:hypothetical protein
VPPLKPLTFSASPSQPFISPATGFVLQYFFSSVLARRVSSISTLIAVLTHSMLSYLVYEQPSFSHQLEKKTGVFHS